MKGYAVMRNGRWEGLNTVCPKKAEKEEDFFTYFVYLCNT